MNPPASPGERGRERPLPIDVAGPGGKRPGLFDLDTYLEYFRRPGLGALYLQFFVFCFSFSAFMSGFALFAKSRFHWTSTETGYLFAYAGFLGILLQGGMLGRLVKKYGEAPLAFACLLYTSDAADE